MLFGSSLGSSLEPLQSVRDYFHSTKPHRPGISPSLSSSALLLCHIGSIGPTEYSVRPFSITAASPQHHRRYHRRALSIRTRLCVPSTKPHRPGISSLIPTLKLCCVPLSFALSYRYISSAIGWVSAASPCITAAPHLPWRSRRPASTISHHSQNRFYQNRPPGVALIF